MTDIETKEKIMKAARNLFADQGYEGTSVREIAKAADVNVASLNYYFASKENLFHEILRTGYLECASELKQLLEKNQSNLENTMVDLFKYFSENSDDLMCHFKMMMSPQHAQTMPFNDTEDGSYGPPGGMIIAETLRREAPNATEEDIHWALKSLYSHVTHISLIHTSCCKTNKNIPFGEMKDLEKGVRRITRTILAELRSPQHNASSP